MWWSELGSKEAEGHCAQTSQMIFRTHMITLESPESKPQWFYPETTLTTLITTKEEHEVLLKDMFLSCGYDYAEQS